MRNEWECVVFFAYELMLDGHDGPRYNAVFMEVRLVKAVPEVKEMWPI
jgi:hypothetical protein